MPVQEKDVRLILFARVQFCNRWSDGDDTHRQQVRADKMIYEAALAGLEPSKHRDV